MMQQLYLPHWMLTQRAWLDLRLLGWGGAGAGALTLLGVAGAAPLVIPAVLLCWLLRRGRSRIGALALAVGACYVLGVPLAVMLVPTGLY